MLGLGLSVNKYNKVNSFNSNYQAVLDYANANSMTLPSAASQQIGNQLIIDSLIAGGGVLTGIKKLLFFATDIDYGTSVPAGSNTASPSSTDPSNVSGGLDFDGLNLVNPSDRTCGVQNTIQKTPNKGYSRFSADGTLCIGYNNALLSDVTKFGMFVFYTDTPNSTSAQSYSKISNGFIGWNFGAVAGRIVERDMINSSLSNLKTGLTTTNNIFSIGIKMAALTQQAQVKFMSGAWENITNAATSTVPTFGATLHKYATSFLPSTGIKVAAYCIFDCSTVDADALYTALYNAVYASYNS